MAPAQPQKASPNEELQRRFPSAFAILFGLIILVAALTRIVPAGQYARQPSAVLGKDPPVAGFCYQVAYTANAIDVSLFVPIIGGFIGLGTATGAIGTGIAWAKLRLKARKNWLIPFLMALFALGTTTYGMAVEHRRCLCR